MFIIYASRVDTRQWLQNIVIDIDSHDTKLIQP